jgi:hypothetical protein
MSALIYETKISNYSAIHSMPQPFHVRDSLSELFNHTIGHESFHPTD